jgi:OOP family OmpA-OmpF porin
MQNLGRLRTTCGLAVSLAMFAPLSVAAYAQDATPAQQTATAPKAAPVTPGERATIEGLVIGRDGASMSVKTADTQRVRVLLSESTKATEKGGFLGMGSKDLGIASLMPGLSVKIEGRYDSDHQLVAKKVTFSRVAYATAKQIDAGLNPTNEQVAQQQDQLMTARKNIEQTQADLAKNQQDIDATKQGLAQTNEATAGNTSAIGRTNGRIGQLDQYETKSTITVNFANGRTTVSKKDKDQLTDFVKAAADTPGYMIEVQGYASKTGSAELNQRLSAERAEAVLAIIQQTGVVPMTRILAPAAMGTSGEVADGHSRSAQAQNRRVVVTIVVNKGITGASTGA